MKLLYGSLRLEGLNLQDTSLVDTDETVRTRLRAQIVTAKPVVVAFFICAKAEAEKYRAGAEAFIDRLFFQEEVDECIEFMRSVIDSADKD